MPPGIQVSSSTAIARPRSRTARQPLLGRSGRRGAQGDLNCAPQPVIAEEPPAAQNGGSCSVPGARSVMSAGKGGRPPGRSESARRSSCRSAGSIGQRRRCRRRRYRWRAGSGNRGPGHNAWWFGDRDARPLPARPGAAGAGAELHASLRTVAGFPAITSRRVPGRGAAARYRRAPTARRGAPGGYHRRSGGTDDANTQKFPPCPAGASAGGTPAERMQPQRH